MSKRNIASKNAFICGKGACAYLIFVPFWLTCVSCLCVSQSKRTSSIHFGKSAVMAYPQGFLFQPSVSLALHSCPSFNSSVILGPRTEELGRSSSGSAFAPYAGSTTFSSSSPSFNSHLPYGGEPRPAATLNSFVVST